jgi:protein-S-isoprenylcysteine O-methyltransferase Ste14
MLSSFVIALSTTVFLASFLLVNVVNMLRTKKGEKKPEICSDVRASEGFFVNLLGIGTLIFWGETLLFPVVTFSGIFSWLYLSPFTLQFPLDFAVQASGIVLLGLGYFLFSWSIVARGRYAVSWHMPKDHRLVTWGPYRYVRHPSYLAYFLLFFGLFLSWLNFLVLPCFVAVPGYYCGVEKEEEMLMRRFGEEYCKYQERTGRFLPKVRRRRRSETLRARL